MAKYKINNDYLNNTKPSNHKNDGKYKLNRSALTAKSNRGIFGEDTGIRNVGEDTTDRNYIDDDFYYNSPEDTQDYKASAQSTFTRLAQVPAKAAVTFASEVVKAPIAIAGMAVGAGAEMADLISGEDNYDFFDVAFNNRIIQTIDEAKEHINDSPILKTYMDTQTQKGDFFDKISSSAYWATEGADGIGFMAAMLVPGLAFSKLGAGTKLFGKLSKLKGTDKIDEFSKKLLDYGVTPSKIDNVGITAANTLHEAGIETGSYINGIEKEAERRLYLADDNPLKIDEEEYEKIVSEAKNEGAFNVFMSNVALLTVPNSMNTAWIYGNRANKQLLKEYSKNFKINDANRIAKKTKEYSKGFKGVLQKKGKQLGKGAQIFGKNLLSEGALEEGGQMAAEKAATSQVFDDISYDFTNLKKSYLETITSTDGQTAIFLGGLLGGGMNIASNIRNSKRKEKAISKLVTASNTSLDNFLSSMTPDIYEKDDKGDIIFKTDENTGKSSPVINETKLKKTIESFDTNEDIINAYQYSILTNNKEQSERLFDLLTTRFVMPFTENEELGPKVLKEILQNSIEVKEYSELIKKDKEKVIDEIVKKAEDVKEYKNGFLNLYSSLFEGKEELEEDVLDFKNTLANNYLGLKINKRFLNSKIKEVEDTLNNLKSELGENSKFTKENSELRKEKDKYEKELNKLNNQIEEFWSEENFDKKLTEHKKEKIKDKKKAKEEEEQINEILDQINESSSLSDLNKIENTLEDKYKDNPVILEKLEAKENTFRKDGENAKNSAEKDNYNSQDNTFDEINTRYKKEDKFSTDDNSRFPDPFKNTEVEVIKKENNKITLKNSEGKTFTLQKKEAELTRTEEGAISQDSQEGDNKGLFSEMFKNKPGRHDTTSVVVDEEGNKFEFVSENAYEYQQNPSDKRGEKLNVEVKENFSDNKIWQEALGLYNEILERKNNKYTADEITLLAKHLPLQAAVNENTKIFLRTYAQSKNADNKAFMESSFILRGKILRKLLDGNKDVKIEIKYQKNGELQIPEGEVQENNIKDLYDFGGEISNIKEENFFIVNDRGILMNTKRDIYTGTINRELAPGELYVIITTASGNKFPLKLNSKKINEQQSEAIYTLYKEMLINENVDNLVFDDISEESKELIEKLIGDDIDFIAKEMNEHKEDLRLNSIVDFYIYQKTKNPKTKIGVYENGLTLFGNEFARTDVINDEIKEAFIKDLSNTKRINIRFRNNKENINPVFNFNNRNYLEYLIENKIINTNAEVGKDNYTFKGDTSIYFDTNTIYVNNERIYTQPDSTKELQNSLMKEKNRLEKSRKGVKRSGHRRQFTINSIDYFITDEFGLIFRKGEKTSLVINKKEASQVINYIKNLKENGNSKMKAYLNSVNIPQLENIYLLNQSDIPTKSNKKPAKRKKEEDGIDENHPINSLMNDVPIEESDDIPNKESEEDISDDAEINNLMGDIPQSDSTEKESTESLESQKTTKKVEKTLPKVRNSQTNLVSLSERKKKLTPRAREHYNTAVQTHPNKTKDDVEQLSEMISSLGNSPKDKAIKKGVQLFIDEINQSKDIRNMSIKSMNENQALDAIKALTKEYRKNIVFKQIRFIKKEAISNKQKLIKIYNLLKENKEEVSKLDKICKIG